MRFRFQPLRATQAAALFLDMAGGRSKFTSILKLLYLADRQSLLETGSTITGDTVVDMKNGPVLSITYDCVKGTASRANCEAWDGCIRKEGNYAVLTANPGDDELSDYDLEVIREVHREHGWRDLHSLLHDVIHQLPEHRDPSPAKRRDVHYADILRAEKVPEKRIREYERINRAGASLDSMRIVR